MRQWPEKLVRGKVDDETVGKWNGEKCPIGWRTMGKLNSGDGEGDGSLGLTILRSGLTESMQLPWPQIS